jgi:hypothetical protein
MHTTQGKKVIFLHNGDYSGDVKIVVRATGQEIEVPFTDLKRLIADYVMSEKISRLEQAKHDEILGI